MESIAEMRLICQPRLANRRSWSETINRKYSIYITILLLKLRFSANQTSVLGGISLIAGSLLMHYFQPEAAFIFAGLGYYLYMLFDTCDGEVARYNKTASLGGLFVDRLVGTIGELIFYISLAKYLSNNGLSSIEFLLLIIAFIPTITRAILQNINATILDGLQKTDNTLGIQELRQTTKGSISLSTDAMSLEANQNFIKGIIWFFVTGLGKPFSLVFIGLIAFTYAEAAIILGAGFLVAESSAFLSYAIIISFSAIYRGILERESSDLIHKLSSKPDS